MLKLRGPGHAQSIWPRSSHPFGGGALAAGPRSCERHGRDLADATNPRATESHVKIWSSRRYVEI
eukprot:2074167-Prymnesium_polylepis.1